MSVEQNASQATGPFRNRTSGFLQHPDFYPHELRPLPLWQQWRRPPQTWRGMGVVCHSRRHLRPGSWVQLRIPLRDREECFTGRVVMVRATEDGYDIGLCLSSEQDSSRLRIVEQYCYMDCYCRSVDSARRLSGHEALARAWVERFAATFPSQ